MQEISCHNTYKDSSEIGSLRILYVSFIEMDHMIRVLTEHHTLDVNQKIINVNKWLYLYGIDDGEVPWKEVWMKLIIHDIMQVQLDNEHGGH